MKSSRNVLLLELSKYLLTFFSVRDLQTCQVDVCQNIYSDADTWLWFE